MLSNIEASFRMEYRHVVPEIVGPKLNLPILALHDPEDRFVPYRYTQRLARHCPHVSLTESPASGISVAWSRPRFRSTSCALPIPGCATTTLPAPVKARWRAVIPTARTARPPEPGRVGARRPIRPRSAAVGRHGLNS